MYVFRMMGRSCSNKAVKVSVDNAVIPMGILLLDLTIGSVGRGGGDSSAPKPTFKGLPWSLHSSTQVVRVLGIDVKTFHSFRLQVLMARSPRTIV